MRARVVQWTAVVLLSAAGCSYPQGGGANPAINSPSTASSQHPEDRIGLDRQLLASIDSTINQASVGKFDDMLPQIVEKVGPGANDGNVNLEEGVLFTSVPIESLMRPDAPGSVAKGFEAFARADDIQKIYPVSHNNRIVSSLCFMWNSRSREPVAEPFDPNNEDLLAREINYARKVHSKENHIPLNKYKGLSYYGLRKHFLVVRVNEKEQYVPLERDPSLGFVPGKGVPAEAAVEKLKELVKKKARADAPS